MSRGVDTGRRRAARRRLVEEEIVRVAAVCFGEMGYRPTTLDTIAAEMGVSKVTLYRYVSNKEELLWRVFERTIESFQSGLQAIVEQDLSADETLRRLIRYQVRLLAGHLPFLTVFFSEEGGLPADLARRVARAKRQYDLALEGVVRAGIRQAAVRDLDPRLLVFAILGACNWLYKWYRPDGRLSPDQIADVFVSLFEGGYLRRTPQAETGVPVLRRIEGRLAALERLVRQTAMRSTRTSMARGPRDKRAEG